MGLAAAPRARVEGKVIFRDSLNVREVFKHRVSISFSRDLFSKRTLEIVALVGGEEEEEEKNVRIVLVCKTPTFERNALNILKV